MQLLGIVSVILFCRNGTQQPVTIRSSLNALSQTQANILVGFERSGDATLLTAF